MARHSAAEAGAPIAGGGVMPAACCGKLGGSGSCATRAACAIMRSR